MSAILGFVGDLICANVFYSSTATARINSRCGPPSLLGKAKCCRVVRRYDPTPPWCQDFMAGNEMFFVALDL